MELHWELDELALAFQKYLHSHSSFSTTDSKPIDPNINKKNMKEENAEEKTEEKSGISKRALKKAAKGKFKEKKDKAPKPAPKPKKESAKKTATNVPKFVNTTPKGEKKDLSEEMLAAYHPQAVQAAWQDWWEAKGFFSCSEEKMANAKPEERFVMVIPPPNVTGSLHLGHGLTVAIEDTLTRWHRMQGHATLWVPGTDHAGIATQSVVERRLMKEENISRHDLGREKFLERVWDWKDQYEKRIHLQLRTVGCSVDWDRTYFSMDSNVSAAVIEAFKKLWEDKLIYRDTRLVNWSCALKTALSEIEVDYIDLEGRTKLSVPGHNPERKYEFGVLTSFSYPVEESDEKITVATTRLETMLGDTGVAIHPEDDRYKHLHGKHVIHPFNGRKIPILLDAELVDMEFGTGAVKITPAHDPNDYECGKRHNLEFITVISDDGRINENGSEFSGMMRYDARLEVEKALKAKGLFVGKQDNKMRLGLCSRSNDVIEPLVKPQWFVNCKSMAERAVQAVRQGDLKIIPEYHEKTWYRWLENIKDWCISRQLWWGHRIPAYFVRIEGEKWIDSNSEEGKKYWFSGSSEEDAKQIASLKLGVPVEKLSAIQDEDVLDTWFSAGLFPFAVFGWPKDNHNKNHDDFYPTHLLETGFDILFFWVARMVMLGEQLTGQLPFDTVYLHSMVRDKFGRKMSKSLGNVIDPLEIINGCSLETLFAKLESGNLPQKEVEKAKAGQRLDFPDGIPECGADAMRFGLLAYTQQGRDINLEINRLVGYRNFCNKLWNATRFAMTHLGKDFVPLENMEHTLLQNPILHPRDRFMLSRLNQAIVDSIKALQSFNFGDLTTTLYNYWLYDLCDVYLELIKPVMADEEENSTDAKKTAQQTLFICLETGLRLLHPVMPFVTEELWQRLPGKRTHESIVISPYPKSIPEWNNAQMETNMALVKDVIHAGRSLRAEYNLMNNVHPTFYIKCGNDQVYATLQNQIIDFNTLARAGKTECLFNHQQPPLGCAMHSVNENVQLYVLLKGLVDFDNEIEKLHKKIQKIQPSLSALLAKMDKQDYSQKVPEKVQQADLQKLEALTKEKTQLEKAIQDFEVMKNS